MSGMAGGGSDDSSQAGVEELQQELQKVETELARRLERQAVTDGEIARLLHKLKELRSETARLQGQQALRVVVGESYRRQLREMLRRKEAHRASIAEEVRRARERRGLLERELARVQDAAPALDEAKHELVASEDCDGPIGK